MNPPGGGTRPSSVLLATGNSPVAALHPSAGGGHPAFNHASGNWQLGSGNSPCSFPPETEISHLVPLWMLPVMLFPPSCLPTPAPPDSLWLP
jgi:hypothetical protein